jgi:hypothetical protein
MKAISALALCVTVMVGTVNGAVGEYLSHTLEAHSLTLF